MELAARILTPNPAALHFARGGPLLPPVARAPWTHARALLLHNLSAPLFFTLLPTDTAA